MNDREQPAGKRFSTAMRGYRTDEVDRFVDRLTEQLHEARTRTAVLEEELTQLRQDLERAREMLIEAHEALEGGGVPGGEYHERLRALEMVLAAVATQAVAGGVDLGAAPEPVIEITQAGEYDEGLRGLDDIFIGEEVTEEAVDEGEGAWTTEDWTSGEPRYPQPNQIDLVEEDFGDLFEGGPDASLPGDDSPHDDEEGG